MTLRFTVLASGSSGNASLLEVDGFGVLIDFGLGPRQLAARLTAIGSSWDAIQAAVLTHTHTDHWRDTTLRQFVRRRVPVYCHKEHQEWLRAGSSEFAELYEAGLVHEYVVGEALTFATGLRCRPMPVRHDGGATFGFRFEGEPDLYGRSSTLAYAADLGCWDDELVEHLSDVDLLAIEFNHDIELERLSGRSPHLIDRVLGDYGHLSNCQAADLLRAVLTRSAAGRLRHLVQLHLSRECNRPHLAFDAARAVVPLDTAIHTAEQDAPGPTIHVGAKRAPASARPAARRRLVASQQPMLPGLDG